MNVERLRLIDESSSIGGKVDDRLLRNFPNGLVDSFEFSGDTGDCESGESVIRRSDEEGGRERTVLDGSVVSDNRILHRVVPEIGVDEISKQPRIDDLELSSEYSTSVDVAVAERISFNRRKEENETNEV